MQFKKATRGVKVVTVRARKSGKKQLQQFIALKGHLCGVSFHLYAATL